MKHIKEILEKTIENTSKAKFYRWNQDYFIEHFDSSEHYEALIRAGNFKKLEGILKNEKKSD